MGLKLQARKIAETEPIHLVWFLAFLAAELTILLVAGLAAWLG